MNNTNTKEAIREQAKQKLAALVVGKVYSHENETFVYEGDDRATLRNMSVSSGDVPLLRHDGTMVNMSVLLGLKESYMSREEFDASYNNTSNAMTEWCHKNNQY
jgi:hypothetical protein